MLFKKLFSRFYPLPLLYNHRFALQCLYLRFGQQNNKKTLVDCYEDPLIQYSRFWESRAQVLRPKKAQHRQNWCLSIKDDVLHINKGKKFISHHFLKNTKILFCSYRIEFFAFLRKWWVINLLPLLMCNISSSIGKRQFCPWRAFLGLRFWARLSQKWLYWNFPRLNSAYLSIFINKACFSCFFRIFELSQGFKNAKYAPLTPYP